MPFSWLRVSYAFSYAPLMTYVPAAIVEDAAIAPFATNATDTAVLLVASATAPVPPVNVVFGIGAVIMPVPADTAVDIVILTLMKTTLFITNDEFALIVTELEEGVRDTELFVKLLFNALFKRGGAYDAYNNDRIRVVRGENHFLRTNRLLGSMLV